MAAVSIYHRFCAAFARTHSGELISCTGPLADELRSHWSEISVAVAGSTLPPSHARATERRPHQPPSLPPTAKSRLQLTTVHRGEELTVYESREGSGDGVVMGVILRPAHATDTQSDDVLAALLLSNISLFTSAPSQHNAHDLTNAIVHLFETRLRYVTAHDKWRSHGGRDLFFKRVLDFVQRGAQLEFCLPAFPCKSSNPEKVSGLMPDRGEQVALEYLDSFLEALERMYEPGAKLYIVSDGHVFSDCSKLPPPSLKATATNSVMMT